MIDKIAETLISTFLLWIAKETAKSVIKKYKDSENSPKIIYTRKQLRSIKIEFYIGLCMAIILIIAPEPRYEFFQIGKRILTVLMLALSLFGFICLSEAVDSRTESSNEKSTSKIEEKEENKL